MKLKIFFIIILALLLGGLVCHQNITVKPAAIHGKKAIWYCPMHPQYTSDGPGKCPICGMDLVKQDIAPQPQPVHQMPSSGIPEHASINVSLDRQQLIGVRTAIVKKESAIKTIYATGEYQGQINAQVFEGDIPLIEVGQKALIEFPAYHQKYEGGVKNIDYVVDEGSRTVNIRLWIKGADTRKFESNIFVNVLMPVHLGEAIVVPREAVMDTGLRKIVFVQKAQGQFEPRAISTGWETDDGYEVKSGVKAGERIVISGNFLLDSESRLQAALEEGRHGQ